MATKAEISSTGVDVSASIMEHVQRIDALNVFARAFPLWVAKHNKTPQIHILGSLDGGVGFDVALPEGTASHEADELFELLEKSQRLASLQVIVEELRQSGVEDAIVQRYVLEGETLFRQLYPK